MVAVNTIKEMRSRRQCLPIPSRVAIGRCISRVFTEPLGTKPVRREPLKFARVHIPSGLGYRHSGVFNPGVLIVTRFSGIEKLA